MNLAGKQSKLEEHVAQRYRDQDYEVFVDPDPSMIPFDIGRYRPDILARKEDLNLIIEVKLTSNMGASYERLRPVIEETRRHPGWRFVLVTERDLDDVALRDESDQPSWEQIQSGRDAAEKLESIGQQQAAYLLLWIAFEQTVRKLSIDSALPLDRLAPSVMIRQLYSEGVLTMDQFDIARSVLETRNLVAHGFREPNLEQQYQRLETILAEILSQQT